jgi:hypothetical protein
VKSTAATRIAKHVYEFNQPFPRMGVDELEQFLIQEAVMDRFGAEQQEMIEQQKAREEARATGRKALGLT